MECIAGYVYLVQSGDRPLYKIGVTASKPIQRIQAIQPANPDELKIITVGYWADMYAEEQALHAKYSEYNVRGEWFEFGLAMLEQVIEDIDRESTLEVAPSSEADGRAYAYHKRLKSEGIRTRLVEPGPS